MDGWVGKVLRVDLSQGDYTVEDLDPDLAKDYIGARGLGSRILYDEIDPKVDALSPENKLIFATGPLIATGALSGDRYAVVTKSPATGTILFSSGGNYFGPGLKFAGYDVLVIEGKSPEPVYISINDDEVKILPADHLWGKTTFVTEDMIRGEIEDRWKARETHIACIGPAGEKLGKFAAIIHDKCSAAARCGGGAVMGSKNLKAVAVRGTKAVTVADGDGFKAIVTRLFNNWKQDQGMSYFTYAGTPAGMARNSTVGFLPTRNFQSGVFDGVDGLSWKAQKGLITKRKACFGCPVRCKRVFVVTDPKFEVELAGLQYETVALLGSNCGISNLAAVIKANSVCNELGIDTMSAGVTIGCAMELFERGFLPEADIGFKLNFGDADAMLELITMIGMRQGFGDLLAEGAYELAQRYGHPELFVGVKKLEMPAYDPRYLQGMGLNYATANRGGCHNRGYMVYYEVFLPPEERMDPLATEGKAAKLKELQDFTAVFDSCGICLFPLSMGGFGEEQQQNIFALLEAATGGGYTVESMLLAGERIWNLERIFNLKAGFTKEDDTLPPRMLEEPLPEGEGKGQVCRLGEMLPEYYQFRGWDENGVPTPEKLSQLGLEGEL